MDFAQTCGVLEGWRVRERCWGGILGWNGMRWPWLTYRTDRKFSCLDRKVGQHALPLLSKVPGHADIIREALDGALSGPLMAAVEEWPEDGWVKPWRPTN
jgi:hypothetical protein